MSSIDLKELETRCIQEEAPSCTASCPIHVDARGFLERAARGAWDEALTLLAATMPLPGIVARICDHPCQSACRRAETDDGVAISDIERAAARLGRIAKRRMALPLKTIRVAVAGSGLSSLTVASDLAYKGYRVTIFEPGGQTGGGLRQIPEEILPREIIDEEIAVLTKLGVEIKFSTAIAGRAWMDAALGDFDAIYVGLDSGNGLDCSTLPPACLLPEPPTQATSQPGLFSGGLPADQAMVSPIAAIAEGRRAAVSIDRYLKKVSLVAGRDKEGSYCTKLFTSLEHVTHRPVTPMKEPLGYSAAEAMEEADRCLQCDCMECVKVCSYLARFESNPKRYVRQISTDATIMMGSHGATSKLVNSCSLCGLCAVVCPHDVSMAEACMEGRRSLASRDKMPPSAHAFALEDMGIANGEKSALALHAPGADSSQFVFFPGCQMAAIYPEHVVTAYAFLQNNLTGVGLMLRCCGVPAKWAARDDLFEDALRSMEQAWEGLGKPTILAACPTCYRTLKEHLPRAQVTTLWQMLANSPSWLTAGAAASRLAVHDPCAARYEPEMRSAVRKVLTRLGLDVEELELGEEKTECCGFGGLMSAANPTLAREVARTRAARSTNDYVTYCAMCRNALAATGKRTLYILDLLFGDGTDPAERSVAGLSERRENRYGLKARVLRELWGNEEGTIDGHEHITLHISPEVRELMEERRILTEDVQKTIDHAEKSGMRLFNPDLGRRLASFKPALVTYWVEYSPEADGFRVHNAYCHRMEIVEEKAP